MKSTYLIFGFLSLILILLFNQIVALPINETKVGDDDDSYVLNPDSTDGYNFNKWSELKDEFNENKKTISPDLLYTGWSKFYSAPSQYRGRAMLLAVSTAEEMKQNTEDNIIVELKVKADPEAQELLQKLKVNIEASTLVFTKKDRDKLKKENDEIMRELDEKFADVPAWGRRWRFFYSKFELYLRTFG